MAYTFKDHGIWRPYIPDPMPDWVGQSGIDFRPAFLRRESDGLDWYVYRNKSNRFAPDSVLACTLYYPSTKTEIIKAVLRDKEMIFPANQRLIEIYGVDPSAAKVHDLFTEQGFDPVALALIPAPPPQIVSVTDYQFAGQAEAEGIIGEQEADDWVGIGTIPETLVAAVKETVPDPDRQRRVLLFLRGTTVFPLYHELTPLLAASFGKDTPEKVAAFFQAAGQR